MMKKSLKSKIFILCSKIVVLCLLAACSPNLVTSPGSPSSSSSPHVTEQLFVSFDNTVLPLRVWLPADEIKGVIIALHGLNDYSNFIKDSASFFNKRKLALYAYDQRGFGQSITRGKWSGWQAMTDDLATFVTLIKQIYPDTPVYILGDSMGGAVAIVTMAQSNPPDVQGVILVAPAVWARSEMPFYQRFALWIAAHTIPWGKVTGQSLGITASDNIEMLRELGKDPLVIKETRIDVLYGLSNLMDQAFDSAERFRDTSLILYGEKDEIIPREPVFDFYQRLPLSSRGQQRMTLYENGYHMLLRDLQSAKVLTEIVEWINDQA
jgi:alpha-beta hydrolase superfamily lysophospholipase